LSDVPLARLPFLSLRGACGHHRWRLVPLHCSRRLGRWECNDCNALVWLAAGSALATLPCVMFRVLAFPFYRCIAYSVKRVHTHSHLARDLIGTVLVATTLYREYAALQSKVFAPKKQRHLQQPNSVVSYTRLVLLGTVLVVTMPCRGAAALQSEAFQNKHN
jgi:hypothetical protein